MRDVANDSPPPSEPRRGIAFPGMPPAAVLRSASDSGARDPFAAAERRAPPGGGDYRDANGNGSRPPASQSAQSAELRRTLHLSMLHGNGGAEPHQTPPETTFANRIERPAPDAATFRSASGDFHPAGGNGSAQAVPMTPQRTRVEMDDRHPREGFIDQSLRERVESDIGVFLAAFDAALSEDSIETRVGLREATDRLLRAGARTRIELERLEARVPLPPRDNGGREQYSWRPR